MANLKAIAHDLEAGGWRRSVAGDADFDAAVGAVGTMVDSGLGLVITGEYGTGKSALAAAVASHFRPCARATCTA